MSGRVLEDLELPARPRLAPWCSKGPVQRGDTRALLARHQLELQDAYLSRVGRLAEDERKNAGESGPGPASCSSDASSQPPELGLLTLRHAF